MAEGMDMDALSDGQLYSLIRTADRDRTEALFSAARALRRDCYGDAVYLRGLIEFTSYCKNDCYYCGIRKSNGKVQRYRLSPGQILDCCRQGDSLGYRTFVLQGGEDPWFTDARMTEIIRAIRVEFPDHAITLSLGERSRESYGALFRAGADRYLLRHETADDAHYRRLHPAEMSASARKRCLYDLKETGFQTGAGFMVGSPFQTPEHLIADLRFLQALKPHMVGIGPFIPQADTPFGQYPPGTLELTLKMVAITRILLPQALIPATTALGTLSPQGREMALKAGANVVMPNLSPLNVRKKYALYDNRICTGDEAASCRSCIERRIRSCGLTPDETRGDFKMEPA